MRKWRSPVKDNIVAVDVMTLPLPSSWRLLKAPDGRQTSLSPVGGIGAESNLGKEI